MPQDLSLYPHFYLKNNNLKSKEKNFLKDKN